MPRTPTTTDTAVKWEERVTDPDSDQLTITLELDAVDDGTGFSPDGTDSSNLSWLSFSKTKSTLNDGTTEVLVNIVADKSGLDQGYSYRFKITANDGTTAVDRTFVLSVTQAVTLNGTKNYVIGVSNDIAYEYDAGTPFRCGTLTYNSNNYDFSSEVDFPNGFSMLGDGTEMYIGNTGSICYQYSLTTPWDITSAGLDDSFDFSAQSIDFKDLHISLDGSKLWINDNNVSSIFQYTLGTNGDITTATYNSLSFDYGSYQAALKGVWIGDSESKLYLVGSSNSIYQFNLSTPGDISTASSTPDKSYDYSGDPITNSAQYIAFKDDGKEFMVTDTDEIGYSYELTTAWDITTASPLGSTIDYKNQTDPIRGIYWGGP